MQEDYPIDQTLHAFLTENRLLTRSQVCNLFGISTRSEATLRSKGDLPDGKRVGSAVFFGWDEVLETIASGKGTRKSALDNLVAEDLVK